MNNLKPSIINFESLLTLYVGYYCFLFFFMFVSVMPFAYELISNKQKTCGLVLENKNIIKSFSFGDNSLILYYCENP